MAGEFVDRLFFHFINVRGVPLESFTCYPGEKEILVLPPAVFCVEETHCRDGKITVILNHAHQESASYLEVGGTNDKEVSFSLLSIRFGDVVFCAAFVSLYQWCIAEITTFGKNYSKLQLKGTLHWHKHWCVCAALQVECAKKFGEQSLPWLISEGNRQCQLAKMLLSMITFHGIATILTVVQAAEQLRDRDVVELADHGEAKYYIHLCQERVGASRDIHEEHCLLLSAAGQTHLPSVCQLGVAALGVGNKEAVRWLQSAASHNYSPALIHLGWCLEYGTGVVRNQIEAVRLFRLAADQNCAPAQRALGACYETWQWC